MRKSKNEVKYYRILGIIELIISILLTSLFIFLILTRNDPNEVSSLRASLIFVFVFAFLTITTSLWFFYHKPSVEENTNITKSDTDKNLKSTTKN